MANFLWSRWSHVQIFSLIIRIPLDVHVLAVFGILNSDFNLILVFYHFDLL